MKNLAWIYTKLILKLNDDIKRLVRKRKIRGKWLLKHEYTYTIHKKYVQNDLSISYENLRKSYLAWLLGQTPSY